MTTIEESLVEAIGDARGVTAANRLCEACVGLLDVDGAAVSLVFDGANVGTFGVSGPRARLYDEIQFVMGEGPCLESVARRAPVMVDDLADPAESRWPGYGAAMIEHRIRGVYAIPVVVAGEYIGALDLFRAAPNGLVPEQIAGMAVAAALMRHPLVDLLNRDMRAAVADPDSNEWAELNAFTRTEVSQATGMLMAQLGLDAAGALARLRAYAYADGRSATSVARDVIDRRLRLDAN